MNEKRYYFFRTVLEEGRNRLHALPGQFFPDGSPVDITYNVHSPKADEYPGGGRLAYPAGTVFGSDSLRPAAYDGSSKVFYTVKKEDGTMNFHPVDDGTPGFRYVSPDHKDEEMNAAYALRQAGIDIANAQEEEKDAENEARTIAGPAGEDGKARPRDPEWKPLYDGQTKRGLDIFMTWIRELFISHGAPLPYKIYGSTMEGTFNGLYAMGESIDTLCNAKRFESFMRAEGTDYKDYDAAQIARPPHKVYLSRLYDEHKNGARCSARKRSAADSADVLEAAAILCKAHNSMKGKTCGWKDETTLGHLAKAMEDGWSLDLALLPERMKRAETYPNYVQGLADGTISLPKNITVPPEKTLEHLMGLRKFARPTAQDGFHVEEDAWEMLVMNLYLKQNTLITGPSGSGKTEVVRRLCEQAGIDFTIIPMGTVTNPSEQLIGKIDLDPKTGGTVFDWAPFALAVQKPGIVLLDEINRIPKNGENILFSCLDDTRELPAYSAKGSDRRVIKIHPDCVFFATANIGAAFTGTKQIDAALLCRFQVVETDYLPCGVEKIVLMKRWGIGMQDAENIAFVAQRIRDSERKGSLESTVSMRETLKAAMYVRHGMSCLKAMERTFLPSFDKGDAEEGCQSSRAVVKQIIAARFNNSKKSK